MGKGLRYDGADSLLRMRHLNSHRCSACFHHCKRSNWHPQGLLNDRGVKFDNNVHILNTRLDFDQ